MSREVFQNAPISEAVLDIRVQLPPDIDLNVLGTFQNGIQESYPNKQERVAWQGGIEIIDGGAPKMTSTGGPDGYLFRSADEKKIVQARLDGFTFNKIKPYTQWEDFVQEAQILWEHYIGIAKPISVVRLGLRYINHIEIPLPFTDFKEYILTVPEIAPGIPQALADFFMQMVIPNEEDGSLAVITETIDKARRTDELVPFIFDIDVMKEVFMPVANGSDIWANFEQLHEFKNRIFFNSITEKGRGLFR